MITVKVKEKDKLKKVGEEVVMKAVINLMIYNNCLPKRATFLCHVLVKEFEETIVCTSPPTFLLGDLNLQPNFQKGRGFAGPQLLEGVAGKEGGYFFQGGRVKISQKNIN